MIIKNYVRLLLADIQKLIEKIFLTFIYFLSIGITSLIAKLAGKSFLNLQVKNSTWEKLSRNNNSKIMY